jgi:hypothetical protein
LHSGRRCFNCIIISTRRFLLSSRSSPQLPSKMTVDPTYPLYPIVSIISSACMLLILTTNFVRRSWNLGVSFLCFWLFWSTLTDGIDAVIWADNMDIKLYIWCDIGNHSTLILKRRPYTGFKVSHLQMIILVVKPACTLLITRRLYKIASFRSVEPPNRKMVSHNNFTG